MEIKIEKLDFEKILEDIGKFKGPIILKDKSGEYNLSGIITDIIIKSKYFSNQLVDAKIYLYTEEDFNIINNYIIK